MPVTYKRIIEETASDEVYNDDWFLKDSPSNDTSKIQGVELKRCMQSGLKEMLTQTEYDALPSTKLSDNVIYYITDTSKIIINGVVYGSGGGSLDAVELTKAQYDALTTQQKNDPTKIYFVTDYNPNGSGDRINRTAAINTGGGDVLMSSLYATGTDIVHS